MAKYQAIYEFDVENDDQARAVASTVAQHDGLSVIGGTLVRLEKQSNYFYGISLDGEQASVVAES